MLTQGDQYGPLGQMPLSPATAGLLALSTKGMRSGKCAVGTVGRLLSELLKLEQPCGSPHPLTLITLVGQWLL